jgi:hypothetical protein
MQIRPPGCRDAAERNNGDGNNVVPDDFMVPFGGDKDIVLSGVAAFGSHLGDVSTRWNGVISRCRKGWERK